jgi:hypothetical protein
LFSVVYDVQLKFWGDRGGVCCSALPNLLHTTTVNGDVFFLFDVVRPPGLVLLSILLETTSDVAVPPLEERVKEYVEIFAGVIFSPWFKEIKLTNRQTEQGSDLSTK